MAQRLSDGILAEAIGPADPAAELSARLVDHLASELQPLFDNLAPALGREARAQELIPWPEHCLTCGSRLAECRSSAASAIVMDLPGLVQKQHISPCAAGD